MNLSPPPRVCLNPESRAVWRSALSHLLLFSLVVAAIPLLLPQPVKACDGSSLIMMTCANLGMQDGVYKVEIKTPSTLGMVTPVVFSYANPGTLSIGCSAKVAPIDSPDMRTHTGWTWFVPSGNEQTINPMPGISPLQYEPGISKTISISGLPLNNSWFGSKMIATGFYYWKWIYVPFPMWVPAILSENTYVDIHFPEEANNHPGTGSGTTINWFYYWNQTIANPGGGRREYDGSSACGYSTSDDDGWHAHNGYTDNDDYKVPAGALIGTTITGIDTFAWTCRHENRHVQTFQVWAPDGYDFVSPYQDSDGDQCPDIVEISAPSPYGPYDPNNPDTNGDKLPDNEDYISNTQADWNVGAANSVDFSM